MSPREKQAPREESPAESELDAVLESIVADASESPESYAEHSKVPAGGE